MAPKRAREEEGSEGMLPSLDDMNILVAKLRDAPAVGRPALLLALKQWQRSVLAQISASQRAAKERQAVENKSRRTLESLRYERAHLERKLADSQRVDTSHLAKLVHAESSKDVDEQLNAFFEADIADSSQKSKILARLHLEINARGGLERDVALQKKSLTALKAKLKEQQDFLSSLPTQVSSMERSSKTLQKLVAAQHSTHPQQVSSARLQRIQVARSLPVSLYTLYQQLQQFHDADSANDEELSSGMTISVTSSNSSSGCSSSIQWGVPVVVDPSSANKRTKRFTVQLKCVDNLIVASASNCGSTLYQDFVLDNLFPNDCPPALANSNTATATTSGKPYQWCNSLAGIALVPNSTTNASDISDSSTPLSTNTPSVRLVARQLNRRFRASATLKHIISSLSARAPSSNKLPGPPNVDIVLDSGKITSVTNVDDRKCGSRLRSLQIKVESSSKSNGGQHDVLTAVVHVAMDEYPARPPEWKLARGPHPKSEDCLYHNDVAILEQQVNQDALAGLVEELTEEMSRQGSRDEGATTENDRNSEAAYDWILSLQLRHIVDKWGGILSESGGQQTARKGRDRLPIDM